MDNGTPVHGECSIAANGSLSFYINGVISSFTSSGAKGFGDVATPTIVYTLFDAARID